MTPLFSIVFLPIWFILDQIVAVYGKHDVAFWIQSIDDVYDGIGS